MIIFETERLVFRPLTLDDLDDLAALYVDPEVMRFYESTRTREQARATIEGSRNFLATIHKADNRFIGRCGLLTQKIDGNAELEVAYMIARQYWNQGLGTEAARGLRNYGFQHGGASRLISLIHPDNIASIRVAEKNGMRYEKDGEHAGHTCRIYTIARPIPTSTAIERAKP